MQSKTDGSTDYTDEERRGMLAKMRAASDGFYYVAIQTGVHAFIEFAGLMNEFIKVCCDAREQGIPFEHASTHTGRALPFKPYHLRYLAEKLGCIYGPGLFASEENRTAFIAELFDGQAELAPFGTLVALMGMRDVVWHELGVEGDNKDNPLAIMLDRIKGFRDRLLVLEAERLATFDVVREWSLLSDAWQCEIGNPGFRDALRKLAASYSRGKGT